MAALRRIWRLSWPSLLTALLLAVGAWGGMRYAAAPFARELAHYRSSETLGDLLATPQIVEGLTRRQREEIFNAYLDPAEARASAGRISWGVANLPTPFVGSAPWPGQRHNATINPDQFRFAGPIATPKPAGRCRIFLTGGSTAYGSGAPDQERTIAGYLQRRLNGTGAPALEYEVITAANPAWSSTQERILIENRLSELAPDLVLSFSGNNDVFWGEAGRNVLWFRIGADEHFLRLAEEAYRLGGGAPLPQIPVDESGVVATEEVARRLRKNIQLASSALELEQVPYLFVLQPTLAVSRKALSPREGDFLDHKAPYYRQAYRHIRDVLGELSAPRLRIEDLSGMFDGHGADQEIFLDSFHFGDRGNALIADALHGPLLDQLARNGRCTAPTEPGAGAR